MSFIFDSSELFELGSGRLCFVVSRFNEPSSKSDLPGPVEGAGGSYL